MNTSNPDPMRPCGFVLALTIMVGSASFVLADDMQPIPPAVERPAAESLYMAEIGSAMTKMMDDMAVNPTGDVDRDFVAMMVPHHRGAIDMALAVLRYGHNEQIKRLAQEIIVTQQQEIAAMRLAVGDPLPPSQPSPAPGHDHKASGDQ